MLVLMLSMAMAANAQYGENKFFDNWSIGAEGGVSTNLHDWDTPNGAVVGINLTKGITPVLSLEFQIMGDINDNANWNMDRSKNVFDAISVFGNTKVNLMNLFCGYKGTPRLFEIQARGGLGYLRALYPNFKGNPTSNGNDLNRAVFKFGFDFNFNLGKEKAWTVSLRPAIVLKTGKETSYAFRGCDNGTCDKFGHNAVGQITAGVTYHFNRTLGAYNMAAVKPAQVTNAVERIVEKPVEKIVEKVVEKVVTKDVGGITVEFAQNKSTLTDTAKAKLNSLASGTVVALDGYSSPEGNKNYNLKLSQRRCDVVKEYLEGRGVKVADVNAYGAAGLESQRVVYVRIK